MNLTLQARQLTVCDCAQGEERGTGGQASVPTLVAGGKCHLCPARSWDLRPRRMCGTWGHRPEWAAGHTRSEAGTQTSHLGLLRGIGEGQRVDAAGGEARLERFGAVSENDLLVLGREGVLSCFKKK